MATPLLSSDCRNTSVDEDWVHEMVRLRQESPALQTRTYLHLMRESDRLFEPETLEQLAPRLRKEKEREPAHHHSKGTNGASQKGAATNRRLPRG
jgi:hypothetical protein